MLTGVCVRAQVLIYAFVGQVYPARSRATGLGWTAGVGRIGGIVGPIVIAALAVVAALIVGHPRDVVDAEIAAHGAIAH